MRIASVTAALLVAICSQEASQSGACAAIAPTAMVSEIGAFSDMRYTGRSGRGTGPFGRGRVNGFTFTMTGTFGARAGLRVVNVDQSVSRIFVHEHVHGRILRRPSQHAPAKPARAPKVPVIVNETPLARQPVNEHVPATRVVAGVATDHAVEPKRIFHELAKDGRAVLPLEKHDQDSSRRAR